MWPPGANFSLCRRAAATRPNADQARGNGSAVVAPHIDGIPRWWGGSHWLVPVRLTTPLSQRNSCKAGSPPCRERVARTKHSYADRREPWPRAPVLALDQLHALGMPAPRADSPGARHHPLGPGRVERCAAPTCALLGVRQQRRNLADTELTGSEIGLGANSDPVTPPAQIVELSSRFSGSVQWAPDGAPSPIRRWVPIVAPPLHSPLRRLHPFAGGGLRAFALLRDAEAIAEAVQRPTLGSPTGPPGDDERFGHGPAAG